MHNYLLSEIADVIDCEHKTAPIVTSSEFYSIRTTDIKNGVIHFDQANRVSNETYKKWTQRGIPEAGDIILAREAPVGEVGWINNGYKACLGQRTVLIKVIHKEVNGRYLLYYLTNPSMKYELQELSGGSVVPHLNMSDIRALSLIIPPLPEQKAIASVLSSLDDKIDLLHRQNKTLEAIAETLFRQWFIEEAEVLGEQVTLDNYLDTISDTHKFQKGKAIFLNTSDIYKGNILHHNFTYKHQLPGQAKKSIKNGDILFSEIRPANGRWAFINFDAEDYVVSTKLMVLRAKNITEAAFMYFYLTNSHTVRWLQMLAESRSGTFPQITFNQIRDLKINMASQKRFDSVKKWCHIALEKIHHNFVQINTIELIRDTLLPKLISGEVRVKI